MNLYPIKQFGLYQCACFHCSSGELDETTMAKTILYMAPGTCARVTAIALEEIGEDYGTAVVRFVKGEHKSPAYLGMNPKGKVPTLLIGGDVLTENLAIIFYLNERFPEAKLLPETQDALTRAHQLADLSFCASTLHPIVSRIRMPQFVATEDAARDVWAAGCEAMNEYFQLIESRLDSRSWWYGEQWSIVDAYLYWIYWRVAGASFDVTPYPKYSSHAARMEERPSVIRALKREEEAQAQLMAEGLAFEPRQFS
jgi:glutathione S-transferase